jgi:hypothetical protein
MYMLYSASNVSAFLCLIDAEDVSLVTYTNAMKGLVEFRLIFCILRKLD